MSIGPSGMNLHPKVSPAVQLRTLEALLGAVRREVASGGTPVVEVDLDLCALMPRHRTRAALATVGAEMGIAEFREPAGMTLLPGYSDEAWLEFILESRLPERYPALPWVSEGRAIRPSGSPFGRFHELYWDLAGLAEDEPTPGLGAMVDRVESEGGRVVFLSGRWLEEHVSPSIEALRRAGIPSPRLEIGNPWHETRVPPGGRRLSDAAVKAWRQERILAVHGRPVAIVDDRPANRDAVAAALGTPVLSVAIAVPGFTCDPSTGTHPLRLSTFETFSQSIGSRPVRPHMVRRHPAAGLGWDWAGLHEGLGRSGLPYILPRRAVRPLAVPEGEPPFAGWLREADGRQRPEPDLLLEWSQTIPHDDRLAIHEALRRAQALADAGTAAPIPDGPGGVAALHLGLVCAWLHSRDVEVLMGAIGYPIRAAGIHDLREDVDAREVRRLLLGKSPPDQERLQRSRYSPWLLRWAASLPDGPVNVGFLNPALLTDLCLWRPNRPGPEDAMDVHRLSDHHEGDGGERFDPLEAAINNLLHQREGAHGVRKEPVEPWAVLARAAQPETGAVALAKNSAARQALRDALDVGPELECHGWLTPWDFCMSPTLAR